MKIGAISNSYENRASRQNFNGRLDLPTQKIEKELGHGVAMKLE